MSVRGLGKKLERLNASATKRVLMGCPACRERKDRLLIVTATRRADGQVVPDEPYPPGCEVCGVIPEMIIEVVETVVDENGVEVLD